jgi:peptidoglycan/xylan/chitin deacetylase (PgdA/CDA1 family)
LDFSLRENVISLLKEKIYETAPGAEGFLADIAALSEIDANAWLDHLAIGHDGIIVVLERGAVLPMSEGSLRVTLPYEDWGDALLLYNKEQIPTSEPPPEPTPEPAPSPAAEPPRGIDMDPSMPMVSLTFDDGPSKHTSRILDLLERHKGSATFFVIGNLVESRAEIIKRAASLGCDVVGHTWDHRNLTKLSSDKMKAEILDTHNAIESVIGAVPRIFRPPYGAVNGSVKSVSLELGFSPVNWSVDTVDWKNKNADSVYDAVMKGVKDHAIILCHDLYGTTADAMERVIPALIDQGYQLVTVSELLKYASEPIEAGKVYSNGV